MQLRALLERLQVQMWFIPALFGVMAVVAAVALVAVDETVDFQAGEVWFLFSGNADGARAVLSTIATAMLTFTGLVFTVTMLVLQQASSQHSPRVMRTFLRDRKNQVVLGLFVATFLFTLLVLRQTRGDGGDGGEFVPGLSIFVAFTLLIASVGAFIFYIDHMANAIRATTILDNITAETLAALDRLFPEPVGEPAGDEPAQARPTEEPVGRISAGRSGVITALDVDRLMAAAATSGSGDRFVEMLPMVGEYVTERTDVFLAWGEWDDDDLEQLADAINTGSERTFQQDMAFGLRQLVDVALRALSPALNDPTTAVQALDRIDEILQRLTDRSIPDRVRRDAKGTARLLLPRPGWDDYVLLAVEEIRLAGGQQAQVLRRLRKLLLGLLDGTPEQRQAVLRRQLQLVEAALVSSFERELRVAGA